MAKTFDEIIKAKKQQLEPEEGPNGVDRWTSNGYGIVIGGKKVEPPTETDEPEPDR